MKGKPFLVAVAAFVIVLFGGAAIAGVGSFRGDSDDQGVAQIGSPTDTDLEVAEWAPVVKETTTTTAAPKKEAPTEAKKAKDEAVSDESKEKDHDESKEHDSKDETKESDHDDAAADLFSLTFPKDGTHFDKKVVAFGGEVVDGATVHRGKYTAHQEGGEWVMELVLSPGKNHVSFKAMNEAGQYEEAAVTVYYDAPEGDKEDKGEEKPTYDFHAKQKYGSCGEEIPYDVFWGKAKPGSTVTASSPYGSNSVTVGEEGHWEMKVNFPTAPAGKTFEVVVKSSAGGKKVFKFTNTGGGGDH